MPRPPVLDWERIRERYVTSPEKLTHQQLADEFKCQRATITRKAVKEGWDTQRAQYRHQVAVKTREKTSAHEAEVRARQLNIAKQMYGIGLEQLMRKRQPRVVVRDGKEITLPPEITEEMTLREIRAWIREGLHIERAAMGEGHEVTIAIKAELSEMLTRLRAALPPDMFNVALRALAPGGADGLDI